MSDSWMASWYFFSRTPTRPRSALISMADGVCFYEPALGGLDIGGSWLGSFPVSLMNLLDEV